MLTSRKGKNPAKTLHMSTALIPLYMAQQGSPGGRANESSAGDPGVSCPGGGLLQTATRLHPHHAEQQPGHVACKRPAKQGCICLASQSPVSGEDNLMGTRQLGLHLPGNVGNMAFSKTGRRVLQAFRRALIYQDSCLNTASSQPALQAIHTSRKMGVSNLTERRLPQSTIRRCGSEEMLRGQFSSRGLWPVVQETKSKGGSYTCSAPLPSSRPGGQAACPTSRSCMRSGTRAWLMPRLRCRGASLCPR